jgi:hypothetical protein
VHERSSCVEKTGERAYRRACGRHGSWRVCVNGRGLLSSSWDVDGESRSLLARDFALVLNLSPRASLLASLVKSESLNSTEQMLRVRIASARRVLATRHSIRAVQSSACRRNESVDLNSIERVSDDVDVCIVGGGPAGLSAAIRIKQLEQERGKEVRVVVVEKGSEIGKCIHNRECASSQLHNIGAHILSGAVIEPRALNELIPNWRDREDHPLTQPALSSSMRFFTPRYSIPIPHPPQMGNKGNYIASLSQFTSWLSGIAEELGVELYPGFAGSSLLYSEDGHAVAGVRLNDVGIDRKGKPKDTFEPGMEFRAKVTLLAEGARGSLTKTAIRRFNFNATPIPRRMASVSRRFGRWTQVSIAPVRSSTLWVGPSTRTRTVVDGYTTWPTGSSVSVLWLGLITPILI